MAVNLSLTQLDTSQAIKRTFDESNDAIRTVPADITAFSIELAASDGDSVLSVGTENGATNGTQHVIKLDSNGVQIIRADSISAASAALSSASSGIILGPTSSGGIKSYQIYAQVTAEDTPAAGITGNITARLDISPFSSGSNFYETSTTLNVPATTALNAVVVSSLLSNIIGQRAQLTLTANNLVGADSVTFYLVGNST